MLHRMLVELGYAEDFKKIGPIKSQKAALKIGKLLRCQSTDKTRNAQPLPVMPVTIDHLMSSYLKS